MRTTAKLASLSVMSATLTVLAVTSPVLAEANGPAPSEAQRSDLLEPLRRIADAVAEAGEVDRPDIYAGVAIKVEEEKVDVFVTDITQGRDLLAKASLRDPRIDRRRITLHSAKHTARALLSASEKIFAQARQGTLPFDVHSTFLPPDGSTLEVKVSDPTRARRHLSGIVPSAADALSFTAGTAVVPLGGRGDAALVNAAGEYITDGTEGCTTGMPVRDTVTKTDYLVSAFHCYDLLAKIKSGGSSYNVGTVTGISKPTDSVLIKLSTPAIGVEQERDLPHGAMFGKPITSVNTTHAGDSVCHDGYLSYLWGHGVPCGWKAVGLAQYDMKAHGVTYTVTGVKTVPGAGSFAAHGDSGGLVFTLNGPTGLTVQGRGMVSAGNDCEPGCKEMYFTQVPDILKQFEKQPVLWPAAAQGQAGS